MANRTPVNCTQLEELFCQEFVIDLIGAAAARRAGSPAAGAKVTAHRMLKRKRVLKRIKKLQEEKAEQRHLTQDRVLEEYIIIAFSDLADYVDIDENTGVIIPKDFNSMGPMKSRALKKITENRAIKEITTKEAGTTEIVVYDKVSFETHDKMRALEFLAKHLNMEGGIDKTRQDVTDKFAEMVAKAFLNHKENKDKK